MTKKKVTKKNDEPKRRKYAKTFTQKTLTKQAFRKDCDIVNVIQRFKATGEAPPSRPVRYGEQEGETYFQNLQFTLADARSQFEALPDEVKERYGNIEGVVTALDTPEGLRQLAEDGLIELKEPLTTDSIEEHGTGEPVDSQGDNPPSTPADTAEGGNA